MVGRQQSRARVERHAESGSARHRGQYDRADPAGLPNLDLELRAGVPDKRPQERRHGLSGLVRKGDGAQWHVHQRRREVLQANRQEDRLTGRLEPLVNEDVPDLYGAGFSNEEHSRRLSWRKRQDRVVCEHEPVGDLSLQLNDLRDEEHPRGLIQWGGLDRFWMLDVPVVNRDIDVERRDDLERPTLVYWALGRER